MENVPFCSGLLFANVKSQIGPFGVTLLMELLAGVIYITVLVINKKMKETTLINQALHSLTVRYQLR